MKIIDSFKLLIAKNKRNFFIKKLHTFARVIEKGYQNANPDMKINGETFFIKKLSKIKIKTVFDVGANKGDWSIFIDKYLNFDLLYAFEPIPQVFEKLINNEFQNKINFNNIALGNENTKLQFSYIPDASYLSSASVTIRQGSILIPDILSVRGDDFCKSNHIDYIDFLKIDTEGHDYKVLLGFQEMLENKKIRIIQFEYGPFSIQTKDLLKNHFELLNSHGYIIAKIYPNHLSFMNYNYRDENFILSNYIAIQREDQELLELLK